ncbi:glycoside hydrolase family 43 protein [bacterium]|nr:glycoside hydrolase family 43 protein [bacterium]
MLFMSLFLLTGCQHADVKPLAIQITNPLIEQRADPWIYRHTDGYYYFTATVPEYDRLIIRRSPTLQGLRDAEEKVIWKKHSTGIMGSHIWAPELHFIDGKWYIYFAAGGAKDVWAIRIYVLENTSANPLEGEWRERGQIKTNWESFSLDATTFEHNAQRYLVWAQHDPAIGGNTSLFIAEMENPWTIRGKQVMISRPEYDWEIIGYKVNEGPAVIKRNGRIFISYSASATDANYAMGLLSAPQNSNLLDPASWSKSKTPVFKSGNGVYGPGHNSFTTTPDGKTDLMVYHGRDYEKIPTDPLRDPNRHTRVQALTWNPDGAPHFGEPAANGTISIPMR